MKNLIKIVVKQSLYVFFIGLILSCHAQKNDLVIKGTVSGISDQKINLLDYKNDILETTEIVNGKFEFEQKDILPASMYGLSLEDKIYWVLGRKTGSPSNFSIMADPGEVIKISLTVENPDNPKKSFSGQIFPEIEIENHSVSYKENLKFNQEYIDAFKKEEANLQKLKNTFTIDWKKEKPLEGLSKEELDKLQKFREASRKLIKDKMDYLVKYAEQNKGELKGLLALYAMGRGPIILPENKMLWEGIYQRLDAEVRNAGLGKHYFYTLEEMKKKASAKASLDIGSMYKNFTSKNVQGENIELKSLLGEGKYIFLDFWASWCGPCRAENPNVLKMYNKYHSKGLEVIAFSLDKYKKSWEKAIEEDGMPWVQLSDLKAQKSPIVKAYGVDGIPDNYLIDGATGKIIGRRLVKEALAEKLEELFEKK